MRGSAVAVFGFASVFYETCAETLCFCVVISWIRQSKVACVFTDFDSKLASGHRLRVAVTHNKVVVTKSCLWLLAAMTSAETPCFCGYFYD